MKKFILFYSMFACSIAIAQWRPEEAPCSMSYTQQAVCEKRAEKKCVNFGTKDCRYNEVKTRQVDDPQKPIMKPAYKVKACDSPSDCNLKMMAEPNGHCDAGDSMKYEKNQLLPGFNYYCHGISSYEKKDELYADENAALKASVTAADTANKALEDQIRERQRKASFGARMISYVAVRNEAKNLTIAQKKQMIAEYGPIIDFLGFGAIEDAKTEITAKTPDGTFFTQADKDAVLAEINNFLGQ